MNCLVCANDIDEYFYTAVDPKGNVDTYCFGCYQRAILDNYPGMVDGSGTKIKVKCECGSKGPMGQSHSTWCDFYKREF